MARRNRIEINPAICGGKAVIQGTRIMVRSILGMVAGGYTAEEVVESYPELSREDVAVIQHAARIHATGQASSETECLLGTPANAKRLTRSVEEARAGRVRTLKLPR